MNENPIYCHKEIIEGSRTPGHPHIRRHTSQGFDSVYKDSEAICYAACSLMCFPRKRFEGKGPGGDEEVALGVAKSKALAFIHEHCKLNIYKRQQAQAIEEQRRERARGKQERSEAAQERSRGKKEQEAERRAKRAERSGKKGTSVTSGAGCLVPMVILPAAFLIGRYITDNQSRTQRL